MFSTVGQSFERYQALWKANGRGVDLNQNFPALWDSITTGPSHASYANYKGTSALSEPESKALANLANSANWTMTISYHSMGNLVYWDFAGNKVAEQSKALAELVTGITGYRSSHRAVRPVTSWSSGWNVTGTDVRMTNWDTCGMGMSG